MRKRAFTLLELLVVITTMTIMLSLLLPALNSARDKSRQTLCLGNQRQLGIAFLSYSTDNGGWGPVIRYDGDGGEYAWDYWHHPCGLWSYIFPSRPWHHKYLPASAFNCPKDTGHPVVATLRRIYAHNWRLNRQDVNGSSYNTSPKLSCVQIPSGGMLLCESYDSNYLNWDYATWSNSYLPRHHFGGVNILFCDGHAKWMAPGDWPSGIHNTLWLGK